MLIPFGWQKKLTAPIFKLIVEPSLVLEKSGNLMVLSQDSSDGEAELSTPQIPQVYTW